MKKLGQEMFGTGKTLILYINFNLLPLMIFMSSLGSNIRSFTALQILHFIIAARDKEYLKAIQYSNRLFDEQNSRYASQLIV